MSGLGILLRFLRVLKRSKADADLFLLWELKRQFQKPMSNKRSIAGQSLDHDFRHWLDISKLKVGKMLLKLSLY